MLLPMRAGHTEVCGCFPTGRHYPGIADRIAKLVEKVRGLARHLNPDAQWVSQALVVLDFETTGRDNQYDRVVEVGIVRFQGGELVSEHNWLINPQMLIPEESSAVHGIKNEDVKDSPTFEQIAEEISQALIDAVPVAYNAEFDKGFLLAEFQRLAKPLSNHIPALDPEVTWIDPLVWAREVFQDEKSRKLADVAERLGVSLEQAHRATDDAKATGQVLLKLAEQMPTIYSELIRLQAQYAARQDISLTSWRSHRNPPST